MKTACQHARENQNLFPTCILAVAPATHQKEVNRPFETDVKTESDRLTVRPDQACKGSIQVVAPQPPTVGRARPRERCCGEVVVRRRTAALEFRLLGNRPHRVRGPFVHLSDGRLTNFDGVIPCNEATERPGRKFDG